MIRYLVDSSALWRVLREKDVREAWSEVLSNGVVGSCEPMRAEFRRSARDLGAYTAMSDMFVGLYPDVPVPKSAWSWLEAAQHRLAAHGEHRALSVTDLLIAATAAHHGLTVLHDDADYVTLSRRQADLRVRNIRELPG